MGEEALLYNSRIIKIFTDYIEKNHPDVDVDSLLEKSKMSIFNVEDPGHWFSQRQVDSFYYNLLTITGNVNIAREAGRYNASSEGLGPVKQH